MSQISMGIGTALSMLGVGAFFAASRKHITSLIPVFVGLPLVFLGVAAQKEDLEKGATAGALGISLIGLLVSVQGLFFPQLFPATDVPNEEHPLRGGVQVITAVLCGSHVALIARSIKDTMLSDRS